MKSEIISIGTELLLGNTINTNAAFLSEQLATLGIDVFYHTVVGDNQYRLDQVIRQALDRSDLIITTGGLGPTSDDITKEIISQTLNKKLFLHRPSLERIETFFLKLNKKMTPNNEKQAYIPEGTIAVDNSVGTAPGIIAEYGNNIIIMLPGPPNEMKTMFLKDIKPFLLTKSSYSIVSKTIKFFGIGESSLEHTLMDLIRNQSDPTIATYAGEGEVKVRITTKTGDKNEHHQSLEDVINILEERVGEYIYSYEDLPLEYITARHLTESPYTVAIAESCTGGKISSMLTTVPGISKSFKGTVVSYSNEVKSKILKVKEETLKTFGAVSRETAIEMAKGVKDVCNTDIGLAVTGIAGPDGGTSEKPVGLVYISLCTPDNCNCWEHNFRRDRRKIQMYAAKNALNYLRKYLIKLI